MTYQPENEMEIVDRRVGEDRRTAKRYRANIDIEWEGASTLERQKGTIGDISTIGCFILTGGEVDDGERVKLFLPLSTGMKVQFSAEVVNHLYEAGYAVRFVDLTPAQRDFIANFIEMHKED